MIAKLIPIARFHELLKASILYAFGVIGLIAIGLQPFVPVSTITRDITQLAEVGIWAGALSQIGALFWCAATSVCFVSYFILKDFKEKSFFLYTGFLSAFLLFDDYFLLHDLIFPEYLGISEIVVLMVYPISILYFLIAYRNEILSTSFLILLSSLGFLGFSMFIDITNFVEGDLEYLLEDGSKFLGILGWFLYFFHTSIEAIKSKLPSIEKPSIIEKNSLTQVK
jgi:hypothetical protein